MELRITSRHDKASNSLKESVAAEIAKLERYCDKITSCHVILDSEFIDRNVEIVINMHNHTVAAQAKAENLGKALDAAVAKVQRQLKRINQKVKDHKPVTRLTAKE